MSKGMCCSASQRMDSLISDVDIFGKLTRLAMTEPPDTPITVSVAWIPPWASAWRMACWTAAACRISPPWMEPTGTGAMPNPTSSYDSPVGRSSTALTALEPMSSPTTSVRFGFRRHNAMIPPSPFHGSIREVTESRSNAPQDPRNSRSSEQIHGHGSFTDLGSSLWRPSMTRRP